MRNRGDQQRRANAIGKAFERTIITKLEAQREIGLIRWWQRNEPGWRKKGNQWFPAEKAGTDFAGHLNGGVSFGIEAKATEKDRYHFNQLHDRQVDHLNALAQGGALALLAIEFIDAQMFAGQPVHPPRRFLCPWLQVPWEVLRTARSLTADALKGWELPDAGDFLAPFIWRCSSCTRVWPRTCARCTCGERSTVQPITMVR